MKKKKRIKTERMKKERKKERIKERREREKRIVYDPDVVAFETRDKKRNT